MKIMNLVKANATVNTMATSNEMWAQTVLNNAYSICGKRIASVPVALMDLDMSYQRTLGKTVKKLMAEWNDEKCDFLIVSYRNGKFYIIDGQHRYSVAKAKGIANLPCIVFEGLTQQDEALRFAKQQDNVNKLYPYDTFKANITCGDMSIPEVKRDIKIKKVCDKYNIEVRKFSNGSKGKVLRCLNVSRDIVDSVLYDGEACFEWIIDLLNATDWADLSDAYQTPIVYALKNIWVDNGKGKDKELEKRLINVFNSITPADLIVKAKHDYSKYAKEVKTALGLCLRDMLQNAHQTEIRAIKGVA